MPDDLDLIPLAAVFSLSAHEQAEADTIARLETSGATVLVTALRVLAMNAAIVATGTISVFEALLQQSFGWEQPYARLDTHLRKHHLDDLAERFLDYRDAINVLKHGAGRSHNRLLSRKSRLDFEVRALDEPFHDEGDVSEVLTLVRADAVFVRSCGRLIEETVQALRQTLPDAPV